MAVLLCISGQRNFSICLVTMLFIIENVHKLNVKSKYIVTYVVVGEQKLLIVNVWNCAWLVGML